MEEVEEWKKERWPGEDEEEKRRKIRIRRI